MRKESRRYGRIMEKNLRILKRYLDRNKGSNLIWKNEIKKEGFNTFGPFQVKKKSFTYELILGPYVLEEYLDHYELKRTLGTNIDGKIIYTES
jgi:hypothetical protein